MGEENESFSVGDRVKWHPSRDGHPGEGPDVRRQVGGGPFKVIEVHPADEYWAKHHQRLTVLSDAGATTRRISGYYFTRIAAPAPEPAPEQPDPFQAYLALGRWVERSRGATEYDTRQWIAWLQRTRPDEAAHYARRWEDTRVSQLCDVEHLAHLLPEEDRRISANYAERCHEIVEWLVEAGAPRPETVPCSVHGRPVS